MNLISYPFSENIPNSEQQVIVSLDGLLLSTHSLNFPNMSSSQAKLAITHTLEDELLEPLDEVSIFQQKEDNGIWSAIVISKEILSNIKREISEKKINCLSLVPEFMLLPVADGKITYFEQNDLILFRASKFNGGKINKDIFFQIYKTQDLLPSKLGEHYQQFSLISNNLWEKYSQIIKKFRLNMGLLAGIFVLSLISLSVDNWQLSQQLELQKTQNHDLFQSVFPQVARIVDLPVQLNEKMIKINKWQRLLERDLLLAMSKYEFNSSIKSIKFKNNKLQVSK